LHRVLWIMGNCFCKLLDGTVAPPMFSLFGRNSPSSHMAHIPVNIFGILQKPDEETPELPSIYHRLASHDSPTHPQGSNLSGLS
jgi:hypothetical protein